MSSKEDQEFLKHKLAKTPEYKFAEKLTKRLTRDLKLFTALAAELLMCSTFRQKDSEKKVPIQTSFICNQVEASGMDGIGFTFVFSSEHDVLRNTCNLGDIDTISREIIFNLDDKGVVLSFISSVSTNCSPSDVDHDYGSYKLKQGKFDSDLLIECMGWLIHENSYPPTPLSSRRAAEALEPYTDNLLINIIK